jgi:hypothetical protein
MEDITNLCERLRSIKTGKYAKLAAEAADQIDTYHIANREMISQLQDALSECEKAKVRVNEIMAAKCANDNLQAELMTRNQRIIQMEKTSWSTYAVIFASTIAFFAGLAFAMVFIPVLSMNN